VSECQVLQALIGKDRATEVGREQQPGGRIEERGLNITNKRNAAIKGRVPLGELPVTKRLKSVIRQGVVEAVEIVGNVDSLERRQVIQEKQICKDQRQRCHSPQSNILCQKRLIVQRPLYTSFPLQRVLLEYHLFKKRSKKRFS